MAILGEKSRAAQKQAQQFTRRLLLLGGGQALLVGALAMRLYDLQVVEGEQYRLKAEENRIDLRLLPPRRGLIRDRRGLTLAGNRTSYRAILIAEKAGDAEAVMADFARLVPLSERERQRALRDLARNPAFTPISLKEGLTWSEVSRIELNLPELPGIAIAIDDRRDYPFGGMAAHILGYVQIPSETDIAADPDPLLRLPGFRIGRSGLERVHEAKLRGLAGLAEIEVNSHGRAIRELSRRPGRPGEAVTTSLDMGLQQFVQQRLALHESASAIVMDVRRGDIYALASTPSFDPTLFDRGIAAEDWRRLNEDPYRPLSNKCIADEYAPGSTFKAATALAALEAGIAPERRVFCPGHFSVGNATLHCWRAGGHGSLDMTSAIAQSCDVFFYETASHIGIARIAEMARRLGLGAPTGIELPGERAGLIPDAEWKKARFGEPWYAGETPINAIGQGYVLATPLQLCLMTARLAGGFAIRPHLDLDPPVATPPALAIDPKHLDIFRRGMALVVNDPIGTAYRARIEIEGQEMAGKSGTAQVRRISAAERESGIVRNEDMPWARRDHALFIAFAPVAEPRYAAAVVIEHGGGGSRYAAPIARDILIECQRRDPARSCTGKTCSS